MYYVLERDGRKPGRWTTDYPFIRGVRWRRGARFTTPVPTPLEVTMKPMNPNADDHGPEIPEFFEGDFPLFRDDLIAAMKEAGVDNLDVYDAVLIDADSGARLTTHKAVNIVGLIAAADMQASNATVHTGGPVIDVDFEGLAIDEDRAAGAYIFRLAESTNAIIVHQKLRDHLLGRGFTNLRFFEPKDVAL